MAVSVFIVDDSAVVRQVAARILGADPAIEVIGAASDPIFAMTHLSRRWPDVIVLDVEMPRMDGVTFLRQLMAQRPTPVVICSTLTAAGAQTTMQALAAGAVAIVEKPRIGLRQFMLDGAGDLVAAVKAAAKARPSQPPAMPLPATTHVQPPAPAMAETTERIVALGASTGGTQALEHVLTGLPEYAPGVVIVQHMPALFTRAFAERLNGLCAIEVREAADGDRLRPGLALIAPGGQHLELVRSGAQYRVTVFGGPPVSRHRPSVDVLFRSVARHAGRNALGLLMTGMGDDGARGLLAMREAGAATLAQDEASSVVYGMPREAMKRGAAQREVGLAGMSAAIMDWWSAGR